ncbi:uncharacterized protein EDB91DRAFT_1240492 [Suillus paluster]|uniref:uncharacterized protein n=1 Tax=Suillus paluster TaxID=48578 RepID=UPI001B8725A4|nr:uncharacterized protein EDB91DRAFT_1240492 [Suillus paluster]KAG1719894.1 hypothetical protein EDB91DRAFT_1240492 [Suillus paluster]
MKLRPHCQSSFLSLLLSFLSWCTLTIQGSTLGQRDFTQLTTEQILALADAADPVANVDTNNPTSHLSKSSYRVLVFGSENITFVREYILSSLKVLDWHVEEDTFTDNTPYGPRSFTNIIATKDPAASRRVILSAHYDSKFFPNYPDNQFLGATDSAAPCAMMLDLAETLNPLLDQRKQRLEDGYEDDEDVADTTLQLVFFDGEEAFKDWTDTDSVYGARHLANKWSTTYIAPNSKRRLLGHASLTELSTIEHIILLDLLGAPNPTIRSYFIDTAWLFDAMISAETRLKDAGALDASETSSNFRSFFLPRTGSGNQYSYGYIGDDHVPFLHKGVNILHIIAYPFPRVWHTLGDDASALDLLTMRRWNMILRVFMSEYLNLRPEISQPSPKHDRLHRSASELVRFILVIDVSHSVKPWSPVTLR